MGVEKPITVRGVEYPSQTDAARALGVTRAAISLAHKRGRVDSLGAGPGPQRKPIVIRGVTYIGVAEAAAAMGCSEREIGRYKSAGKLDQAGFTRGRGLVSRCDLAPWTIAALDAAAAQRGMTPAALAVAILAEVIEDGLIPAILDDGGAA